MEGLVSISWTFVFQIMNTLIIYFVLKRFLFKPTKNFMDNRTKGIADAMEEAAAKNKEAEAMLAAYQQKLDNVKEERNEIIRDASKRAEQRGEEIVRKAQEEAHKLIEKANIDIQRERQKAMNEMKDQMAALVIMAASKVIEKELSLDVHQKMIKQFIDEVGEATWQN
jgi:F-type H+-transporting ATPase subunit b